MAIILRFLIFDAFFILLCGVVQVLSVEHTYQSYQRGITCTTSYLPCYPRSLREIQNVVKYAISKNLNIKAIGSKHSISDAICTPGIPVYMTHINHFYYNRELKTARVGAGLQIVDFLEYLHRFDRTVSGFPEYGGITVGGAIAMGAHGTGLRSPSSLSDILISVTLVDGQGEVRKLTKDDEHFDAVRVNLGLLGVVYEMEISTEPQYKIHIQHTPIGDNILRNGSDFAKIARNYDYFQVWWFPTNRQIVLGTGNRVPTSAGGNCSTTFIKEAPLIIRNALASSMEMFQSSRDDFAMFHMQTLSKLSLYRDILLTEPAFVEQDGLTPCLRTSVGYSHKMLSNVCEECLWDDDELAPMNVDESEIAIPLHKLMPALRTLWEIFDKRLVQFPNGGIRVRFLAPGTGYMSMNEGYREWATIGWATTQRWDNSQTKMGLPTYQVMSQVLVEQYGGRPHWAKNGLHWSSGRVIRDAHPSLDLFVNAMNEFDPQERFMNAFGERVKYGNNIFTIPGKLMDHCALHDLCICKRVLDCGNGGMLDYYCGDYPAFPKYKVCLPGMLENMKESYSRSMISLMAAMEDYNEFSVYGYLQQYTSLSNILPNILPALPA